MTQALCREQALRSGLPDSGAGTAPAAAHAAIAAAEPATSREERRPCSGLAGAHSDGRRQNQFVGPRAVCGERGDRRGCIHPDARALLCELVFGINRCGLGPAGRTRPGFTELRRLRISGRFPAGRESDAVGGGPGRRRRRGGGVCAPACHHCTCVAAHQRWERPSGGRGPRLPAPCPPALPGGGRLSCPPGSGRLCPSHSPGADPELAAWGLLVGDPGPSLPPEFSGWEGLRFRPGDLDPCPPSLSGIVLREGPLAGGVCPSLSFLLRGVGLASRPLSRCCGPTPPRKGPLPSRE